MERYVSFVKEWATDHGLTYMCSIGDPRLKADYAEFKKTGVKPKKSGRASKYQTKEEARLANIAKTNERKQAKKMIQAGTPERMVEPPPPGQSADILRQKLEKEQDEIMEKYGKWLIGDHRFGQQGRQMFNQLVRQATPLNKAETIWNINRDRREDVPLFKRYREIDDELARLYEDTLNNKPKQIRGKGIFDRGNQMPPSARKYLKDNGDQTITSVRIERIPLGGLQKSLTAIVYVRELLTKFKKPENIPQDDLFHLQMVLTLSNGRRVMWAKEEVIKLSEKIYMGDKMEFRNLGKTNIKLQDFVDKTAKTMGAKFALYNAFDNNCQDFIMASLKSNGLGTQADYDFVKQDTKDLFKGRQWLIDMMKGATDLASAFNVLWEGKGLEDLIPLSPTPNPFNSIPDRATRKVLTNSDLRRQIDAYLQPFTPPMEDLKRGPKGKKKFGGV